jgi:hypothetical protein
MKSNILKFSGVSPIRVTDISPVRKSTDAFRQKWLDKVNEMGMKQAR